MFGKSKQKNILFINGGVKEFGNRFRAACDSNNLNCTSVRAHHNSVIIAEQTGCRYFHLNEEVSLTSMKYAFFRVRGMFSHMTSLVAYILKHHKVPFNDLGNLEHTQSDEKLTQMVRFACNRIPIPKSIIFSAKAYKKNEELLEREISFPCVMKTNGSKGENVWLIDSREQMEEKMKLSEHELVMIQDIVDNDYDTRALVFGDKLLGAIRRFSNDGFYNNVAKGGRTEEDSLTKDELKLSIKAMKVLGLNFGGVDFVRTEKTKENKEGIVFFEINKGPQVYGLEDAVGVDIPAEIVGEIVKNHLK
jgi:RimK family alpha-L-glutamate ligase